MSAPDLRDELAATIDSADYLEPGMIDYNTADRVLAHPRIARALTILEAIERATECGDGCMMIDGWSAKSARTAIVHLRRIALAVDP